MLIYMRVTKHINSKPMVGSVAYKSGVGYLRPVIGGVYGSVAGRYRLYRSRVRGPCVKCPSRRWP